MNTITIDIETVKWLLGGVSIGVVGIISAMWRFITNEQKKSNTVISTLTQSISEIMQDNHDIKNAIVDIGLNTKSVQDQLIDILRNKHV